MITINDTFTKFWQNNNPKEDENSKIILSTILENERSSKKQFFRCYYLILLLFTVFFCLDNNLAALDKGVAIFSIEISNVNYILWSIVPIISFLFYQGITLFLLQRKYASILEDFFEQYAHELYGENLESLLHSPSFIEYELLLDRKFKNRHSGVFLFILGLVLVIIPFVLLVYMFYRNFLLWNHVESILFKAFIGTISLSLIYRIITLIANEFKHTEV